MITRVVMPKLTDTMEEGVLVEWKKQEGDAVVAGDVLAEIETDKATMEVEAVDEGTVGKILIDEGTEAVKVNTPIAVVLEDGEDASAVDAVSAAPTPAAEPAPTADTPAPAPVAAPIEVVAAPVPEIPAGT